MDLARVLNKVDQLATSVGSLTVATDAVGRRVATLGSSQYKVAPALVDLRESTNGRFSQLQALISNVSKEGASVEPTTGGESAAVSGHEQMAMVRRQFRNHLMQLMGRAVLFREMYLT